MQTTIGLKLNQIIKSEAFQKCKYICSNMFNKYLLLTNVGISVTLSATGDVIQQHYEILRGEEEKWDHIRTYRMSISGMTVGILCHYTYGYLDKLFPGRTFKTVMKKVVVDQIVCSPMCITVFFVTLALLEKSNLRTLLAEMRQKGQQMYIAEWLVWPPAQIFNFYVLPTKYRVLYDNTISLGFDVYFSYVKHKVPLEDIYEEDK